MPKDIPLWLGLVRHPEYLPLFFAYSETNPPLLEQLYLYMKRFRTQPSEFYAMERSERLEIFDRELKLLKDEKAEYDKMKNR